VLPWQQHRKCHSVSFVMFISGAKFEEHCPFKHIKILQVKDKTRLWDNSSHAKMFLKCL